MPNIQFMPQNEATFICPQSAFERFKLFLENEHIHIIRYDMNAGSQGPEDLHHIQVSDVDNEEATRLISRFNELRVG
jgi:hypothetical protein